MEQKYKDDYRKGLLEALEDDYSMLRVEFDGTKDNLNCQVVSDCVLLGMMNQERESMDIFDLFDAIDIYNGLPKSKITREMLHIFSISELCHDVIYTEDNIFKSLVVKVSDDKILKIWR